MSPSCPTSTDLLRLADGEVTRNEEAKLRAHLDSCGACRERNASVTHLLADIGAPLDQAPAAGSAEKVLRAIKEGREASPATVRHPVALWTWTVGLVTAAAAVVLVVATGPSVLPERNFQARGGANAEGIARRIGITLYAPITQHSPLRDGARIASQTAFTASYRNLEEKRPAYLLVFGLDSQGETHWLYPAFTNPNSDPEAVRLPFSPKETALPDSVVLDHPALGKLRLFLVVTPQSVHLSTIESLSRDQLSPASLAQRLPGSHVEALNLMLVADEKGALP